VFEDHEVTSENEHAIRSIRTRWSSIRNSNVVSIHYAFTTTEFHDTSLIIVSDYHPASATVADKPSNNNLSRPSRNSSPQQNTDPLEAVTWIYIAQVANALKAIHSTGLAARCIDVNKVVLTDENRVRLNGCAIDDLFDKRPLSLEDLQRRDFYDFGRFLVAVGAKHTGYTNSRVRASDPFLRCSERLKSVITWLLDHITEENNQGIDYLLDWISPNIADAFDASLRLNDELDSNLTKELENSRLVRLMTKLNCLTERPEHEHDRSWSPQGPRAVIALFRDYVFHQVDAQGNPVMDMGHMLASLNKLDAGVDEKMQLTTRDESNVIIVTYKEVKAEVDRAWQELSTRSAN
jgi:PAB-dependent poly(A)-specific ribonuclease subunit 3